MLSVTCHHLLELPLLHCHCRVEAATAALHCIAYHCCFIFVLMLPPHCCYRHPFAVMVRCRWCVAPAALRQPQPHYTLHTVRKNARYSKRKWKWKKVDKLSTIMLKGCQITEKIKSFPTEFFKNQPEVSESRMAVKGLNWIRSKNRLHFENQFFKVYNFALSPKNNRWLWRQY